MAGAVVDDDDDELRELPFDEAQRIFSLQNQNEQPAKVKPVGRFSNDITALKKLFESDEPPHRLVREKSIKDVMYVFGDASGQGFGASWELRVGEVYFLLGTWGEDMSSESSSLREWKNLVETLQLMATLGHLSDFENLLSLQIILRWRLSTSMAFHAQRS